MCSHLITLWNRRRNGMTARVAKKLQQLTESTLDQFPFMNIV